MNDKKVYSSPELVKHGKLEDQTQSGGAGAADGVGLGSS